MTKQSDIIHDKKYIPVLDHGFVGLVDYMGSDAAIVQAARVSYGAGTKSHREDRGLIRYLMRHKHTSPLEMNEIKIHIKLPIFVFRQWVRHRTASLNEYSGRYSVMTDEFYMPDFNSLQPQSSTNKQGREGEIDDLSKKGIQWLIKTAYETNYDIYKTLLGKAGGGLGPEDECPYDPYHKPNDILPMDPLLSDNYPGLAREVARIVLPLGNYTELYWKQNLHNMFHLIKLRTDSHAQKEIREYAQALYNIIQPLFPYATEAFEDYVNGAVTLSRMENNLMKELLHQSDISTQNYLANQINLAGSVKSYAMEWGMTESEFKEFLEKFNLIINN